MRLVCVGTPGAHFEEVSRRAEKLGLGGSVVLRGYATDEELGWLYRNAAGVVFPSLFEGFGLPVVEAMAFGIPVACSRTSALPEIAGDAAILFDPSDAKAIAESIVRLATDPTHRESCVRLGKARAADFLDAGQMARSYIDCFTLAVDPCIDTGQSSDRRS
jgi:glycosyltransferase involved in cell wall biosynthesis